MSIMHLDDEPVGTLHPLDLLERAVEANGWAFERAGRDELNLSVAGKWSDHHFNFSGSNFQILITSFSNGTGCLKDKFSSKRTCHLTQLFARIHVKYQLGNPISVAKINESHTP